MQSGIIVRVGTKHIAELAHVVEDSGFDLLAVTEHTHVPVGSMSVAEQKRRSDLLDPFVALAAAAARTTTLGLVTAVTVLTHREPIVLAKTIASLDLISDGRVAVGVGMSSVPAENRTFGIRLEERLPITRERVGALRALWSQRPAEYQGDHVQFTGILSGPDPVQRPHPPIWLGGGIARLPDVAAWADGWMPHPPEVYHAAGERGYDLAEAIVQLREAAAAAGRGRPTVTIFGAPRHPEAIASMGEAGVDNCLFTLERTDLGAAAGELRELHQSLSSAG
jgi:probable F420-dependent oxidoreductase